MASKQETKVDQATNFIIFASNDIFTRTAFQLSMVE